MAEIEQTERVERVIKSALGYCKTLRNEFVMPEHLLLALVEDSNFNSALAAYCSPLTFANKIEDFLDDIEVVPQDIEYHPELSIQTGQVIDNAIKHVENSGAELIDIPHLVKGLLELKDDSWASYFLKDSIGDNEQYFMKELIDYCEYDDMIFDENIDDEAKSPKSSWKQLVTCMNDNYLKHNPLIGREHELKRTIQVLCRCDKNNPLHVGEPGVGKTALVWGLTRLIEENKVPKRLQGSKIYQLDMGTLLAGTQYRGDFEKRIKQIMDGVQGESDNNIVYIDEIHTLVGAGSTGDGAMDASNMLKPYLESGEIRFIGSTTYDEYNRYIASQKSLVRRFQQIDIAEPSIDDAVRILEGLRPGYEKFHGVKFATGAMEFAVRQTARHISDRFLPDKAIDLIDEAGAYRETHPLTSQKRQTVDRRLMGEILAKMCKIDAAALRDTSNVALQTLADDMRAEIFGQDRAVNEVVEAVQMAKAGLGDDDKPMASLLFVGPTGVGKTEVARTLARQLGVSLVRFDMSEYAEKHAVAKLIGAPAGYVGYEDGGQLTAALRKSPNCVLLFDEIEKAHPDIFNIFLQMMDYATLTDNHGQRADLRGTIIIMTSNAGAQYASRASIGFMGGVSRGEAMLAQVKKTFKPEFINRLTDIVVFGDMTRQMASLILDKKIAKLQQKLTAKNVTMHLTDSARQLLLSRGFTPEYGAREIDRVIGSMLKPLLMRELLFGSLKKGGEVSVAESKGQLVIANG